MSSPSDDISHSSEPSDAKPANEDSNSQCSNDDIYSLEAELNDQAIQAVDRLLRQVYKKSTAADGTELDVEESEFSWLEQLQIAELAERFDVLSRLGGGTFGVVFRARDRRLRREVALKILRPEWMHNKMYLVRFLRESRVASQLNHTHIVRVLEAGKSDNVAWEAMDVVEGDSLDEHLRLGKIETSSAVRLVSQLADALSYAHQRGVVHRDIKPANILVNRRVGQGLSDASAFLTDFGLARIAQDQTIKTTASSGLVGTPQYMAPEMIEQGVSASGPQSDIYSLGVVLYECLSGQNPFNNNQSLLDRFRHSTKMHKPFPAALSGLPKDLSAICQKSLAQSLPDRYTTAESFANDLRRVLDGLPVSARALSLPERTWRVAKQNTGLSLLTCGLIGCLLMLVLISVLNSQSASIQNRRLTEANEKLAEQQSKAQQLARDAELLRDQAMTERTKFAALAHDSSIANAYRSYEDSRVDEALEKLEGLKKSQPQAARSLDWRLLHAQINSEFRKVSTFSGPVQEVCRIPNSQLVAVASGSQVDLIDFQTGATKSRIRVNITNIQAMAVHPSKSCLFLGGSTSASTDQAELIQVDWTSGQTIKVLDSFPTTIESICSSKDGEVLLAASRYESPRFYNLTNGQKWQLPGNRRNSWLGYMDLLNLAVYHQSHEAIGLLSSIDSSNITRLGLEQLLGNGYIGTATVVGDGPLIAVASQIGIVYLVNVLDGSLVGTLSGCKNISTLCSNASGLLVAAGTAGGEIGVWQIPDQTEILSNREAKATRITLEDRMASSSDAQSSFGRLEKYRSWQLESTFVNSLAFVEGRIVCGTDSGELVIVAVELGPDSALDRESPDNGSTTVWETAACRESSKLVLRNRSGPVYRIPTSQLAATLYHGPNETSSRATSMSPSGTVDLFPHLSPQNLLGNASSTDPIAGLAASTDGDQVAWPSDSLNFEFLDGCESWMLSRMSKATTTQSSLRILSLSPDSSMVAVASEKYWLNVLSTTTDKCEIARFELPGKPHCVQWAQDQNRLFVAGNFDSIVQCEVDTGVVRKITPVHTSTSVICLTGDQKQILSGHTDGTLRVTPLTTRVSQSMLVHDAEIRSIVLDRNEEIGLSADVEGNVVAWNLPNQQRLGTIWRAMPQNRSLLQVSPSLLLSPDEDQLWLVTQGSQSPLARWLMIDN